MRRKRRIVEFFKTAYARARIRCRLGHVDRDWWKEEPITFRPKRVELGSPVSEAGKAFLQDCNSGMEPLEL